MGELDAVKLKENFEGIPAGTEGTIVLEYDGDFFEVEYIDEAGSTIGVITTPMDKLQLVYHHK